MTLIKRDGFAREELHRRRVLSFNGCSWCGSFRERGGLINNRLFQYYTVHDDDLSGDRKAAHKGLFCSKSCHDSYHA